MNQLPFERTNKLNLELLRKIAWNPKGQKAEIPRCGEGTCQARPAALSAFCRRHTEEFYCLNEA